jgi:hypothetical protein
MQLFMVSASHSPLLDFPAKESPAVLNVRAALAATRARIEGFDPDLVVLFGVDHYGGQHMACMPSFCVGVEATALADVGGTPGRLDVPRDLAIQAVGAIRKAGVDTAVSYDMAVDHGFSQALSRLLGGVDRYPVLPIFVSCIQPPYVGAVAVLFLFVVMMLDVDFSELREGLLEYMPIGGAIGLALLAELLMVVGGWVIDPGMVGKGASPVAAASNNVAAIGAVLYTKYVFFFQTAGLVLLVAMIGAIVLTLRHKAFVKRQNISEQVARGPATSIEIVSVETGKGL